MAAAKALGETASVLRFRSAAANARHNGTAPLPVWSSNRTRHRLSRTDNRQLNAALHRIARMPSPPPPTSARPRVTPQSRRRRRPRGPPRSQTASVRRRLPLRNAFTQSYETFRVRVRVLTDASRNPSWCNVRHVSRVSKRRTSGHLIAWSRPGCPS
ncbi:transposase [Micromonospora chersina]|uniref:transposase n=1 Tax=Micromonospora chersina TaxID=47854 RepID=UPI0037206D8F